MFFVFGEFFGIVEFFWVFIYGDFSVDNVMVRLESVEKWKERGKGRLRGGEKLKWELRLKVVIDWVEVEFLLFGMGLYGLESILGYFDWLNMFNVEEVGGRF